MMATTCFLWKVKGVMFIALLLSVAVFIASCKKEKKDKAHTPQPQEENIPNGSKIGGDDFTFRSGKADNFNAERYWIYLYTQNFADPCTEFPPNGSDKVSITIGKTVGTYAIGPGANNASVTLFDGSTNYVAISGTVVIDSINATTKKLYGKLTTKIDNQNYYNGSFAVSICH